MKILLCYSPFCTPASPPYSLAFLHSVLKPNKELDIESLDLNLEFHKAKFSKYQKYYKSFNKNYNAEEYEKTSKEFRQESSYVYSKNNKQIIQTIIAPENNFWCWVQGEQILMMDDFNFDGHTDLMIVRDASVSINIPYYFWVFNKETGMFQRDTVLEEITDPEFDPKEKTISSSWRSTAIDHGISRYKYINGKITLIEENEIALDFQNQWIITKKKLVNGKMKLIERTVEKSKDEK